MYFFKKEYLREVKRGEGVIALRGTMVKALIYIGVFFVGKKRDLTTIIEL